jgi:hypothetical protein
MMEGGILSLIDSLQIDFILVVGVGYLLYDKIKSKQK